MSEHIKRVNRVIDYISTNLDKQLTLDEVAEIANFSRYHFHRIFSAVMNESLYQFILRLRLEKAAFKLVVSKNSSITDIAFGLGFTSSAVFARAFKDRFGVSASDWRNSIDIRKLAKMEKNSKIHQTDGNMSEENGSVSLQIDPVTGQFTWRLKMVEKPGFDVDVRVEDVKDMTVAYIRHVGPYRGDEQLFDRLFTNLMKWAGPKNLFNPETTRFMTIYHDDPSLTDDDKLRIDVCMTVPEDTEVSGEVGKMSVSGGKYAIGKFEVNADEYPLAWKALYGSWLPESGYTPDDRPPFELYLNDPKEHPEHKHQFEIYMPITAL